ncbi:hypothetical protein [Nakamurella sp. PAMC28650]|uniref:hypothetical protein n=1 Tax=Nakamurella sp. PAMC28650 TaxID=2762325 RepID=UPI00164EBE53|nr:hypothetical protein [Nakamurella sp. PAMC28650]QNK79314.1 hypothetical protein H7F38_13375 [Nakamurella sp. PAMC28650]
MSLREERSAAADFAAAERAGAVGKNLGVVAPGILHIWDHPGHGQQVVFTAGELLPPWAAARLLAAGTDRFGQVLSRGGDLVLVAS